MCLISSGSPFCQGVPGGCAPGNRLKPGSCAAFRVVPFFARGVPGGCAPGNRLKPGSCAAFRVVPFFARGVPGGCAPGNRLKPGSCAAFRVVPFFARGVPGGCAPGNRLKPGSCAAFRVVPFFARGVPGGCAPGNRLKPGSCAAFRVVPSFAKGFQGAAREGTARNLVHVPHFEWFPLSPGGSRGLRAREPLETWFMCRISSGSPFRQGVPGGCARGNHLKPGSCAAFRAVPSAGGGGEGTRPRVRGRRHGFYRFGVVARGAAECYSAGRLPRQARIRW